MDNGINAIETATWCHFPKLRSPTYRDRRVMGTQKWMLWLIELFLVLRHRR